MKRFAHGVVLGIIVMLPAGAFGFADYAVKKNEGAPSSPSAGATAPAAQAKGPTQKGKVLETMNGGGYTYIYLETKDGKKQWFAVPVAAVSVGQEVELMQGMEMGKFTSRALNRTFDSINFSGGLVVNEDDQALKKAHAGIASDAAVKEGAAAAPIKVEKAVGANAYTIAEVYGKKADLVGKSVTVRGKVVKVSEGIMNKNWVHLRDGSGDSAKGTHNLIVTTKDLPAVGDIVTITGDFFRDKDFGSGYKYDVIVENATVKK